VDWLFFVKAFTAVFIVVDPLGCVPVYITMTSNQDIRGRKRTALRAVITAAIILLFFSVAGRKTFAFFGTTMGAFQIAGGILLFLISMSMMRTEQTGLSATVDKEVEESKGFHDVSLVPIGIPLLAGPSSIAAVIVLVEQSVKSPAFATHYAMVVAAIVLVMASTYIILRISGVINRILGTTGLFIAMRLMGLILAAVSVQFIADGLFQLVNDALPKLAPAIKALSL